MAKSRPKRKVNSRYNDVEDKTHNGNNEFEEEDDEEEDDNEGNNNSGNNNGNKRSKAASNAADSKKEDERIWVQCNTCDKWRALPSFVGVDSLPDLWYCELNTYDQTRNRCDAPEEPYKMVDGPLKSFMKLWVRKLKSADRAESRSSMIKGRKKQLDVEWIKCCNPACGKWRSVMRGMITTAMLRRLNKNRWGSKGGNWYCSMNTWDDSMASCSAPQEPLYDCPWNLGIEKNS